VFAILDCESPKLAETAGKGNVGDARRAVGCEEPLTRKGQSRSTHPTERCGAKIALEVRFQGARPNARHRREGFETNRLMQVALEPSKGADKVAGQCLNSFGRSIFATIRARSPMRYDHR
jgi:hypothetical protein